MFFTFGRGGKGRRQRRPIPARTVTRSWLVSSC